MCAVGGDDGVGFAPYPIISCSKAIDSYETLPAPAIGGCDYQSKKFQKGNHTAYPCVFCSGFTPHAEAFVTLNLGLCVIKEGLLRLVAHSTIIGDSVTFYLTDSNAVLDIKS